jgi:putative Mn2+ efflux pump MntP
VTGLLLIALSVGLGNFAASIGIGTSGVDNQTRLRIGVTFGLFEALMPVVGLLIGADLAGPVGRIGRYLGGGLLVVTGLYSLWQARHTEELALIGRRLSAGRLAITGLALSVDNLVVGFALGIQRISVPLAAITIGTVSVALSLLGLELGQRLGARFEQWSEEMGGAVLIVVGSALFVGLL